MPRLLAAVLSIAAASADAAPATRGAGFAAGASGAGFNVLVVTLDTTRADRLGCYGRAGGTTPHLDALAARGLRFAHAVTVAPTTLTSHATIFTGLIPPRHGVRINSEDRLDASQVTLAEVLSAKGYETAAFVSSFVLDARFGLDQGFATYDDRVETATGPAFAQGTNERAGPATTDAALAWLARRDAKRPFFAWVHYFDAHAPYAPPAPFAARFPEAPYDGEVAAVDAEVGRLLDALDRAGLRDRTLVVVLGDHGESLGQHGEATHGHFVYRSVMDVPLIVANPRLVPVPAVVDGGVVSTADVTPTVLDLVGAGDDRPRDGVSLAAERPDRRRTVYMETLVPFLDFGWSPLFGLRRLADSYVLAPRPEYYDLIADPGEGANLHATAKGDAGLARDQQAATLSRLLARFPPYQQAATTAPAPDPETRARLESLGYLGGAGAAADASHLADPKDMVEVTTQLVDANALLAAGRLPQALALCKRALARSKGDRSVLLAAAKIYLRMNRLKEAEDALRGFTAIQPKADVSVLLAQILILDGREAEAERLLAQAESLDPRHGAVWIARGDLARKRGNKEDARAAYEKARTVDPYRAGGIAAARLTALSK
jgi:arylsulfatase A-like enzyme/predicted negative regulator of RcsB-dependent stress response